MRRICLIGTLCLLFAGCSNSDDGIREYTVPKEQSLGHGNGHPTAKPVKERLIGAMVREGDRFWFFKLKGPDGDVNTAAADFSEFIKTVDFKNGKPIWKVPDNWKERGGSGMRFATIFVDPQNPKLELTVIPLPSGGDDEPEQILANVNRWRGQVGLRPRTQANLYDTGDADPDNTDEVRKLTIHGRTVVLVQFVGFPPPGGSGMPPFMNR